MKIGKFDLNEEILIIAEIGNNHEGNYTLAEEMIHLAAEAGADAVKFQTIVPDRLVSVKDSDRIEQLEKFRLSWEDFRKLSKTAQREGVVFLSTPFDLGSVGFLNELVPAFKIGSGDNNFLPLIEAVGRTGKPVIISSGLADIAEISKTKDYLESVWRKNGISRAEMAILHCVSAYPVRYEEANLLAIRTLREHFDVTVGYSDHTVGIDACLLSVALGARIIEKHFTVDKDYSDFRDHKLSADPEEMGILVKRIRQAEKMLGDGRKVLRGAEREALGKLRRYIVARHDMEKGAVVSSGDICWVRSDGGLGVGRENYVIGKKLKRGLRKGDSILTEDLS